MTRPLAIEERDEMENLAAECAAAPERLRACLAELVRLRAFAGLCRRYRGRLPIALQRALADNVPELSSQQQWARQIAANDGDEECRAQGVPRLI